MPPRIPHAGGPIARHNSPGLQPELAAQSRPKRRMSDVLEAHRRGPNLPSREQADLLAGLRGVPDVHIRVASRLAAIWARSQVGYDRQMLVELTSACQDFQHAPVLAALLDPKYARMGALLLGSLPCGVFGDIMVTGGSGAHKYMGRYVGQAPCGYGILRRGDASTLMATFQQGRANGAAILIKPDGAELTGVMRDDVWVGVVTEVSLRQGVRVGPMVLHQFEGSVRERGVDGRTMLGTMLGGRWHGPVLQFADDGSRVYATMRSGVLQGRYQRKFADGAVLTGTMQDGSMVGPAKQMGPGIAFMLGDMQDGHFEGQVERRSLDGSYYIGSAKRSKPHGQGYKSYPSGYAYEGAFAEGYMHGWGTEIRVNGDRISGQWTRNQLADSYHYETAAGLKMLMHGGFARTAVTEMRPRNAQKIRYAHAAGRIGRSMLTWHRWQDMLDFNLAQKHRRISPNRQTEDVNPWRDWQPDNEAFLAIGGILEHVTAAQKDLNPATHHFLLGLMSLLGPAQPYGLYVQGERIFDYNLFGHHDSQASFVAGSMPLDSTSVLEIVLRPDGDTSRQVSMLFHQEQYENARGMFMHSFDYMVSGLTRVWRRDMANKDAAFTASNLVLNNLLDHGPCLEGRTTSMTLTLRNLDLIEDVSRGIADLSGKDIFEQSNEVLRLFREQSLARFAQMYGQDVDDTLAIENDSRYQTHLFNTALYRAFLKTYDAFANLGAEQMDAVIRYQLDVIGVLAD